MKQQSINLAKQALIKIQEAIDLLDKIVDENEDIDASKENLGFCYADIEHEINNN